MTAGLARWALLLLVCGGLGSGCAATGRQEPASRPSTTVSAGGSGSATDAAGPTSSAPATSLAPAAGSSAAQVVAALPGGPGSGSVVITYDGMGQADSTFLGQCTHVGPATTLAGTAGSATVNLVFDPSSVTLTVTDVGLGTSKAALARVDLTVAHGRLTLAAPLVSAGQVIGSVSMDVTCGA